MSLYAPEQTVGPQRVTPQDTVAEQAVLGAMLLELGVAEIVFGILTEADFYREHHRTIFRAMQAVVCRREPIDLITVSAELRREALFDEVGGSEYLTALIGEVPTAAHVRPYARRVWECARLRRYICAAMESVNDAYAQPANVGDFLAEKALALTQLAEERCGDSGGPVHLADLGEKGLAEMDAYVDDLSDAENMPGFGIPSLDHALGGLPWGSLVTIMGFIGFGKSTLALQLALEEAWHRHRGAAIFCGEMPRMELEAKLLELYTGSVVRVTPSAVRQDPERTKALAREGMEAILRFNLAVQGSEVPFTYGGITRDIRHLHRTRGIRLFVVDAFGNLATGEREDVLELKSAAYGLRSLAGQLGAVIATTSQVTAGRGGETWTQWATELDAQSHITLRLAGADDTQTIEEQRAQKRVKLIVRKVRRGDATGRKFTLTREGGRMVEVDWVDREPPPPAPRRKEREDARYGV